MPAALPQGRRRQQFVSLQQVSGLAGAGHAVTWGHVSCHHVLILSGGENPSLSLLAGVYCQCQHRNLCCKTAQALHEAKFAETRPSRPQSWAAHPADRTGQVLQKGDGGRDLLWCTATASLGSHRSAVQKQSPGISDITHSSCRNQADSKCLTMESLPYGFPLPPCNARSFCSGPMVPVCNWMGHGNLGKGMVKQILVPVTY